MRRLQEDWEFDVLGVYNWRRPGTKQHYFDFLIEHHDHIEGDIVEAGVFRGRSLLATGLLLKELGSDKQVYGFDSFLGFPPRPDPQDHPDRFAELHAQGRITDQHLTQIERLQEYHRFLGGGNEDVPLSSSGDFSATNLDMLQRKIDYLGLDNVHLVPGFFSETMTPSRTQPAKICAALLDCDLYQSYRVALAFVWDRLSLGGYIYLDEYYSLKFPGARLATDEFFADKTDKPRRHKLVPGQFERWYVHRLHA